MQSDIISEIIEVEDNATKLIDEARQKANRLIANADMEANKDLKEAVKERKLLNHNKLDEIVKKNKAEINEYEEEIKKSLVVDVDTIDKIATSLATKICNSSVFDK